MRHDLLPDVFTVIRNAEAVGRPECQVSASELVKNVLNVMKKSGYIEKFNIVEGTEKKFKVQLKGKINNCKALRPRFPAKVSEFEKFEKRFLPSRDVGIIIISTSNGVMTHNQAKEMNVGGRLLAYVY